MLMPTTIVTEIPIHHQTALLLPLAPVLHPHLMVEVRGTEVNKAETNPDIKVVLHGPHNEHLTAGNLDLSTQPKKSQESQRL